MWQLKVVESQVARLGRGEGEGRECVCVWVCVVVVVVVGGDSRYKEMYGNL